MTCCVRQFRVLLLALPLMGFQPAGPGLATRVTEVISERWGVDTSDIELFWPRPLPETAGEAAITQLAGQGEDGWFVVLVRTGGRSQALRLRAGTRQRVAVAARPLASGQRIGEGDYRLVEAVRWGPPRTGPAFPETGWVVRRPIAPGDTLLMPAVMPPAVVLAGQPVRLIWSQGPVEVALEARALHDARVGELVHVELSGSARRTSGTVTGPGTARLGTLPGGPTP